MQTRRGFLRTLFGAGAAVATGGLRKVAEALTSKQVISGCFGSSILDAGYFYAPYIPLQVPPTFVFPQINKPWPSLPHEMIAGNSLKNL